MPLSRNRSCRSSLHGCKSHMSHTPAAHRIIYFKIMQLNKSSNQIKYSKKRREISYLFSPFKQTEQIRHSFLCIKLLVKAFFEVVGTSLIIVVASFESPFVTRLAALTKRYDKEGTK